MRSSATPFIWGWKTRSDSINAACIDERRQPQSAFRSDFPPHLAPCGCDGRARLRGGRLRARLLSGASFDGHRRGGRGERDRRGRSAGRRTAYASVGLQDLRHGDAAHRRYGGRVRRRTQGVLFGRFAQARRGGGRSKTTSSAAISRSTRWRGRSTATPSASWSIRSRGCAICASGSSARRATPTSPFRTIRCA